MVLGIAPALVDRWAGGAAQGPRPAVEPVHLALWHGLNLPLALSGVALAGGAALFAARRRLAPVLAAGGRLAQRVGLPAAVLRGVNAGADRVTAVVQNGSLPAYAGVILTTAALLTTARWWPGRLARMAGARRLLGHVAVCVPCWRPRWRPRPCTGGFSAALLVGATGYAMAGLFVVQGGADLALTQVAIETLSTVLFVLVLRRLDRFEPRPAGAAMRCGRPPRWRWA